jgi:hypothetical protein
MKFFFYKLFIIERNGTDVAVIDENSDQKVVEVELEVEDEYLEIDENRDIYDDQIMTESSSDADGYEEWMELALK